MTNAAIDKLVSLIQDSKKEPQVDRLLSGNLNLNQVNSDGATALQSATLKGYERVVDALLKAGANVNYPEDGFGNPV